MMMDKDDDHYVDDIDCQERQIRMMMMDKDDDDDVDDIDCQER